MAKASQGVETGDISDARDSEDEEVEIRYNGAQRGARTHDHACQCLLSSGRTSLTVHLRSKLQSAFADFP